MPKLFRFSFLVSASLVALACAQSPPRAPSLQLRDGLVPADAVGPELPFLAMGSGTDTSIVIAGGNAIDARYLEPVMRQTAADGVVIFLVSRGRGVDSVPATAMGFERDAVDIERLRQHLGINKVRLIAHANGARVAMRWAMQHPEQTERVILLGPAAVTAGHVYAITAEGQDTAWLRSYVAATGLPERRAAPERWCREWWPGEFQPMPISAAVRADKALAGVLCDADSAVLARRFDVRNASTAGPDDWAWPDSIAPRRMTLLVITGDSLPMPGSLAAGHLWHSALIWTAGTDSGRVWSLPGDPIFPQHGRTSQVGQAVASFLHNGVWPVGARRPRDADARVYDEWVGRERRDGLE